MSIVIFLLIGAVSGWLAGIMLKGGGLGILGNIIVGIIGSMIGGFLFDFLEISTNGLIGSVVTATIGAIVLLFGVRLIK